MKALTGVTIEEFKSLLATFKASLHKNKTSHKEKRKRAVGGGRKHTLKDAERKLFFILFYLKCYPTYDLAGFFFGVDRSQIQRWVKALLPVLEQSLAWEVALPQRKIGSVEEFIQRFPGIKDVFIDGTERRVQRPKKAKSQRKHYSGKQHQTTHKNLVITSEQGQFLCVSLTKPGARQDYHRFKQAGFGDCIPPEIGTWVDLGFMGIKKDYPHLGVVIPHKRSKSKPLTPEQKVENKVISAIRIRVEHALAGLKRFRCLTDTYRNKGQTLADTFILIAAGLWNYHLRPV